MNNIIMKKKISEILKLITAIISFSGLILSFIGAERDGYSHWAKRLLYFTCQSNVWMIAIFAVMLIAGLRAKGEKMRHRDMLYTLRFALTVSITLTGFVFCTLLAPFSARDGYNAWSASSIMSHVITPILSVVDLFYDPERINIGRREIGYSVLPPLFYLIFASVFCILKVDFGRGDPYPYFFMNYYSPAGVFGFSKVMPFAIGSFYWMLFLLGLVLSIAAVYARLLNGRKAKTKSNTQN